MEPFSVLWSLEDRASCGCVLWAISRADQRPEGTEDKKISQVKDDGG